MSRLTRYLLHLFIPGASWYLIFSKSPAYDFKEANSDVIYLTLFLVNWFSQYVLLSPLLKFQFWGRFVASIIFWGLSFFGSLLLTVLILFQTNTFHIFSNNRHDYTLIEIMGFIIYCIATVIFYEAFSSSTTLKEDQAGDFIKRIIKKLIDPHNQGIQ